MPYVSSPARPQYFTTIGPGFEAITAHRPIYLRSIEGHPPPPALPFGIQSLFMGALFSTPVVIRSQPFPCYGCHLVHRHPDAISTVQAYTGFLTVAGHYPEQLVYFPTGWLVFECTSDCPECEVVLPEGVDETGSGEERDGADDRA